MGRCAVCWAGVRRVPRGSGLSGMRGRAGLTWVEGFGLPFLFLLLFLFLSNSNSNSYSNSTKLVEFKVEFEFNSNTQTSKINAPA